MADNQSAGLLLRLFAVYIAALYGGSLFIFLNNMVINGRTLRQLLQFNIPFVLLSDLVLAVLLLGISYWRLGPVLRYFRRFRLEDRVDKEAVFNRLVRFPMELFRGMILLSLLFIFLYHFFEIMTGRRALHSLDAWLGLANTVVRELSLSFILSFLLHSASRRLLRGYAIQLDMKTIAEDMRHSAVRFIALSVFICFVITFAPASRVIVQSEPGHIRLGDFILLSVIYAVFAIGMFALYISQLRKELSMLVNRLYALSRGMKTGLHQTVPILSGDETGRLTSALNMLQHRVASTYEDVERQLKLAYTVQERLLPREFPAIEGVEFAVLCQQCQAVGGDFYDMIPLGGRRYCIAIGDVSGKGLPAALLMSAMMTGLRTEAMKGGTAGDILTRLNKHVYQMTQGKLYATIGLAVIELASGTMELDYASAGHLDPYLVRGGHVMEWQCSSFPLGISQDEQYEGTHHTLATGDLFVLYTDGIIESGHASGSMLGFERWEHELRLLQPDRDLQDQLTELLSRIRVLEEGVGDADDRTLLLMKWNDMG
ncbi:serine/threonine-protein phosphatase [Paenibacillus alkaliterrae]|uniref:PP2C family protein-serine/threonine phosphatase n=1 Tax=Paenibacillus alkaliterrae TaxID=320909 RepID=UPI001F2AFEE2|nr:PP2C family protein-serine/threonine phosphatase [Paenibacillus alkaliterrae]MCF2939400.1 serine/threonine-protein phosphatase [Paenibacillus alkaliterrae]